MNGHRPWSDPSPHLGTEPAPEGLKRGEPGLAPGLMGAVQPRHTHSSASPLGWHEPWTGRCQAAVTCLLADLPPRLRPSWAWGWAQHRPQNHRGSSAPGGAPMSPHSTAARGKQEAMVSLSSRCGPTDQQHCHHSGAGSNAGPRALPRPSLCRFPRGALSLFITPPPDQSRSSL